MFFGVGEKTSPVATGARIQRIPVMAKVSRPDTEGETEIHRTVSDDGTEIAGGVHGQGPPLVLVHGGPHDGDLAWESLVPHLTNQYTCYLPSIRGRGLSADSPDLSPPRLQEDITAFVDSIGEPVGLVGWSAVEWTLGAIENSDTVAAVALYEPNISSLMGEDDLALLGAAREEGGAALADDRPADASRALHRYVCTDLEFAALGDTYFDRCAALLPKVLPAFEQAESYEGPLATDPDQLGQITEPVLILRGQKTLLNAFVADSAKHVAEHAGDSRIHELPGLGHFAPLVEPEPIAEELINFFESVPSLT